MIRQFSTKVATIVKEKSSRSSQKTSKQVARRSRDITHTWNSDLRLIRESGLTSRELQQFAEEITAEKTPVERYSERPELPGLLKSHPRFRRSKDRPRAKRFKAVDEALKVYRIGQEVECESIGEHRSGKGTMLLVNNKHWGMIYRDRSHCPLKFSEYRTGYVENIRPDGKLDISWEKPKGPKRFYDLQDRVWHVLKYCGGAMNVGPHTDATVIRELFQMSKSNWKIAVGNLYKYGAISISKFPEERMWVRNVNFDLHKFRQKYEQKNLETQEWRTPEFVKPDFDDWSIAIETKTDKGKKRAMHREALRPFRHLFISEINHAHIEAREQNKQISDGARGEFIADD